MSTKKGSELIGAELDYWVAKAEGITPHMQHAGKPEAWVGAYFGREFESYNPSEDWARGGPIIERERIDLEFMDDGGWRASISEWRPGWRTEHLHEVGVAYGPTPLIAAMRAYVASKFGEEVSDA